MKKFWIFILGVIVAIVGFYIFTDKSPTTDIPPINNEQQGENNAPIVPDSPSDVDDLETQYTTNTFNIDYNACYFDCIDIYNPEQDSYFSTDLTFGAENVQFIVGQLCMFYIHVNAGYEVQEVYYDNNCVWSGSCIGDNMFTLTLNIVPNAVFEIITQSVSVIPSDPEEVIGLGYPVSSVVIDVHNASDYYVDFCDANAVEPESVDFLEFGKEYRCEITISDPDRIISAVSSSFDGYHCPYSSGYSYIFTVSNLDGSTPIFSIETVNITEKMGVSVYGDGFSDLYLTDLSGNRVDLSNVYIGATYYCNFTVASNCALTEIAYSGGGLSECLSMYLPANESSSFSFCLTELSDTFAISFSAEMLE